ncbi:hypothetical protein [Flavobacterium sp. J27]|uniref:hypothetical protein n=1 Tax=Flavobacterium sp. J27 TaxID=2060419 RepID=UPI0010316578|nr:hypothetical protein [Flavobacterium sp. J27]
MKEEIKNEAFVNQLIRKSSLETPSEEFTLKVMQQIEHEVVLQKINAPLISKTIWVIIGVLFSVFLLVAFYLLNENSTESASKLFFERVFQNTYDAFFTRLKFSKTVIFSLLLFFVFSLLQMFFIVSYKKKRWQS